MIKHVEVSLKVFQLLYKYFLNSSYSCTAVWVRVLWAICSPSPLQNQMSFMEAQVGVHYSFWNFRFQFKNPNHSSTLRFETFTPKTKAEVLELNFCLEHEWKSQVDFSLSILVPLFQVENPKMKFHNSIIQLPIQIVPQFHYSTSHPNRNLDPSPPPPPPQKKKKKKKTNNHSK